MADQRPPTGPAVTDPTGAVLAMARNGDTARLAVHIDNGLSTAVTDATGAALLAVASRHGHVATVRMLLEHGADPDLCDDRGHTALTEAVANTDDDVVRTLLSGGADADAGTPSANATAKVLGLQHYLDWFGG